MFRSVLLACALGVVGLSSAAVPGTAATMPDCSNAGAKMMQMMHDSAPANMPNTASADTAFSMAMGMDQMKNDMHMAQLEATCGKDAKKRAEAKKMVELLEEYTRYARQIQQGI